MLTKIQSDNVTLLTKMTQLEGKFSCSRGEALPNDFPVALPVVQAELIDILNDYLASYESRKTLVSMHLVYVRQ
jgi:hypothetical protein